LTLTAITRGVSPAINQCELGFLARQEIDVGKAAAQHHQYETCLRDLDVTVLSLPAEPALPDSMFVEDPAVVVPEVAVITRMGTPSRRGEAATLAPVLARYRPLRWIYEPATLEGGDVLHVGTMLYVGLSARTNQAGIEQLAEILRPFGYSVQPVLIQGCLHLKSACTSLDGENLLANRAWLDPGAFRDLRIVDVPSQEPRAANVLAVGRAVLVPATFPRTANLLARLGWKCRLVDISELMKAEAGLTCSSILFETRGPRVNS
jgi:dimethylargininase